MGKYLEDRKLDSILESYFNEGLFKKYKEKKEAKSEQERYDKVKKAYINLSKFLEYPFNLGFQSGDLLADMFYVAKLLKISESQFVSKIKKIKFKNSEKTMFEIVKDDFYGEYDCKNIKELFILIIF